jgi:hypothetical protein
VSAGTAATSSVPAAPADTAKSSPRDEFGLSEQEKRARAPVDEPREPDSITGRIAKVGARPTGELVLTFEDGQVWTQVQVEKPLRLKAGDQVTIRRASLGSYLLVTPSKVSTRVRRVK